MRRLQSATSAARIAMTRHSAAWMPAASRRRFTMFRSCSMGQLDRLRVWDDPAIRDGLAWYRDVAENRRPAKFRIAATVSTHLDPATASEEALWAELEQLTPGFLTRWEAIRAGAPLMWWTAPAPGIEVP